MLEEEILRTREELEVTLARSGLRRDTISESVAKEPKTGMIFEREVPKVSMIVSSSDLYFKHDTRQGTMFTQNALLLDTLIQEQREENRSKAMQNDL